MCPCCGTEISEKLRNPMPELRTILKLIIEDYSNQFLLEVINLGVN